MAILTRQAEDSVSAWLTRLRGIDRESLPAWDRQTLGSMLALADALTQQEAQAAEHERAEANALFDRLEEQHAGTPPASLPPPTRLEQAQAAFRRLTSDERQQFIR